MVPDRLGRRWILRRLSPAARAGEFAVSRRLVLQEECVGRERKRAIAGVLGSLALCALGFLALQLWHAPEAGGQEPPVHRPYLTIHGPNDGEPLNNSVELRLDVAVANEARVIVYQGARYLQTLAVVPIPGGGIQSLVFPIDSTVCPNGPFSLSFYLFTERMDALVASASYVARIANPTFEPGELLLGHRLPFKLRGRPGDTAYRIEAGKDLDELTRAVGRDDLPREVSVVLSGEFPALPGGEDSQRAEAVDVVLNVDSLVREQTLGRFLILWTGDPGDGKWAHSKPLAVRSLPGSEDLLKPAARPPASGTSTYRR